MNKKIDAFIDSHKKNFIEELKELVDIRSVREVPSEGKPFGEGPASVLKKAIEIAARHGFSMVNMENYAGEITYGKDPELMLLAHLDVVDEGDFWTREPYNMKMEGNKAFGRGTTDDKGPSLACLYALSALKEVYGKPVKGIRLVMGCGEETGSEDMEYYFSKREKLPYTFSPDADYPVINLEKGRYAPAFYKKVSNDGEKILLSFKGGNTSNIVPCRAEAEIKGLFPEDIKNEISDAYEFTGVEFKSERTENGVKINAIGVSAHAAQPHTGKNAQQALLYLIGLLPLDENDLILSLKSLYGIFPYGDTEGKAAGVMMSDAESGNLTLNTGVLAYDNGLISGNIDIRCPLCATQENVKDVIVGELKSIGFSMADDIRMTPVHYVSEDAPAVKTALEVYENYTGNKGKCLAIGGGTYVHDIDGGIAFGIEFPGNDYHIHGADEYANIDELLMTAKMYAGVIYKLCY